MLLANPQPGNIIAAVFVQAQEPTTAPNPPEQPQATTEPVPDKTEQATPDASKPAATAPKKTIKPVARKPAKKRSPPKEDPIVVIRNGGTLDSQGQISYSATDQQTLEKRKNTDVLLNATTTDLKQLSGKQLNPTQQDMVKQIHNYMARSKDATKNGDIQGANNLAMKAHLLSQELVKP
ncbi:MAG TPA: hypothetical protein VIW67_01345 [Terriglobales bacterium]